MYCTHCNLMLCTRTVYYMQLTKTPHIQTRQTRKLSGYPKLNSAQPAQVMYHLIAIENISPNAPH